MIKDVYTTRNKFYVLFELFNTICQANIIINNYNTYLTRNKTREKRNGAYAKSGD